jgi:hypothetical protein
MDKENHLWLRTCGWLWQGIDLYLLLISAVGLCSCPCMTILFMLYQLFSDPFGLLVFPSSCFNVFAYQKQNHLVVSLRTHYDELDFLRKICEEFLDFLH